ncbi:MAG: redoxin family protein, partial [Thiohalospira sp.]
LSDDIVILAISNDLPFALKRFCAAEGIDNLITLSDHKDLDFSSKYGFLIEELRLIARGVIVIDKENTVKYVEYVPEIGEEPDYESAINAAKLLV